MYPGCRGLLMLQSQLCESLHGALPLPTVLITLTYVNHITTET